MPRAYQSPASGWHCGPQCAHMPNLALRYHSGVWYFCNESHVGLKGPFAKGSSNSCCSKKLWPKARDIHKEGRAAAMPFNKVLRFIYVLLLTVSLRFSQKTDAKANGCYRKLRSVKVCAINCL